MYWKIHCFIKSFGDRKKIELQKNAEITIMLSRVPVVPLHMTEKKTNSMEMLPEYKSRQCQERIRNRTDAKS